MNINIKVVYLGCYEKFHIKTEQRLFHPPTKHQKEKLALKLFSLLTYGPVLFFFFICANYQRVFLLVGKKKCHVSQMIFLCIRTVTQSNK